jgi:hypothetical protein
VAFKGVRPWHVFWRKSAASATGVLFPNFRFGAFLRGRMSISAATTWLDVDESLRAGTPGQPGGSLLARLLAARRGVRNRKALPKLAIRGILDWADAHWRRTGKWPSRSSGLIFDTGEKWSAVDAALRSGTRVCLARAPKADGHRDERADHMVHSTNARRQARAIGYQADAVAVYERRAVIQGADHIVALRHSTGVTPKTQTK